MALSPASVLHSWVQLHLWKWNDSTTTKTISIVIVKVYFNRNGHMSRLANEWHNSLRKERQFPQCARLLEQAKPIKGFILLGKKIYKPSAVHHEG